MATSDDLGTLLAQAGWVRGLCRELVGAGDAEDLAQDAWVVALEQHARATRPAAWMSGVVRKLAGRRWRAAERRGRRERAAARGEAQPAADELVAEAELQQSLIRAVTELEEPYRSTVLLRFYRGLAPAEIARVQTVPAATVRTRLARALEKLRTRLDHDHGGRNAWVAVLAAPAALESAAVSGGTLLGTKLAVTGAGALALVAGYAVITGRYGDHGGPTRGADTAAAVPEAAGPARARQAPPDPGRGGASEREALAASTPTPRASEVLVYGAAVAPDGTPVALEWVGVTDARAAVRSTSSLDAGSWSIAGLAPGRYALEARAAGFATRRETLELGAREHERHDLVLEPAPSIPVKLVDATGALLIGDRPGAVEAGLDVVLTRDGPPDGPLGMDGHLGRALGLGEFEDARFRRVEGVPAGYSGLLRLRASPPLFASLVAGEATLDSRRIDGPMDELVFRVDRARLAAVLGGVRARFVDAVDGRPLEGQASLDRPNVRSFGGRALAADGGIQLDGVTPGLYRLRFFHPGFEDLDRTVRVRAGAIDDLGDVAVWPRARLRGRVVDARGEPLDGSVAWVPVSALRGPGDVQPGTTHQVLHGAFEIPGAARAPVRLVVRVKDHALLSAVVDASAGDLDDVLLVVEEGVEVVLVPAPGSEGRQVTLADARGLPFETWRLGGRRIPLRLASGSYGLWTGRAEVVEAVEELVVGTEAIEREVGAP